MQWMYVTQLDASACMASLLDPVIGSVDALNPFHVEITPVSDYQVYLVYRGRRFSKARRTEYILSVLQDGTSTGAKIHVEFKCELYNNSYPMTPVTELDEFLKLALNASRIS